MYQEDVQVVKEIARQIAQEEITLAMKGLKAAAVPAPVAKQAAAESKPAAPAAALAKPATASPAAKKKGK